MAGVKRKQSEVPASKVSGDKKIKTAKKPAAKPVKEAKKQKHARREEPEDLEESDTTESENGFAGFSAKEGANESDSDESMASGSDSDVEMEDAHAEKATKKPAANGEGCMFGPDARAFCLVLTVF